MLREVVVGEMMHRLIWCPYLPEPVMEEEEPDTSTAKLLVPTGHRQRCGAWTWLWSMDLAPWLLGM